MKSQLHDNILIETAKVDKKCSITHLPNVSSTPVKPSRSSITTLIPSKKCTVRKITKTRGNANQRKKSSNQNSIPRCVKSKSTSMNNYLLTPLIPFQTCLRTSGRKNPPINPSGVVVSLYLLFFFFIFSVKNTLYIERSNCF